MISNIGDSSDNRPDVSIERPVLTPRRQLMQAIREDDREQLDIRPRTLAWL